MHWDYGNSDHDAEITEILADGGVVELIAECNTCGIHLGSIGKADQPKYRLAYNELRDKIKQHVAECA